MCRNNTTIGAFCLLSVPVNITRCIIYFSTRFFERFSVLLCHYSCNRFFVFLNQLRPLFQQTGSCVRSCFLPCLKSLISFYKCMIDLFWAGSSHGVQDCSCFRI